MDVSKSQRNTNVQRKVYFKKHRYQTGICYNPANLELSITDLIHALYGNRYGGV